MQAVRGALRPAFRSIAAPRAIQTSLRAQVRLLSQSSVVRSEPEPIITGPGGKAGTVPTDEEQSTGLERMELSYKLSGGEAFPMQPLDASRIGTLDNPVMVESLDPTRIIGCTGVPADSHDTYLFTINKDRPLRCPECGSAYQVDFQGEEHDHGHH